MSAGSLRRAPDYRRLRPGNLRSPAFRHLLLLLFWPAFGLVFLLLERGGVTQGFTYVHCALDDLIPFCEWFLIPYLFWFVFLAGMLAWTLFFDVDAFRRMMWFIILTYGVTVLVYFLFPTAQGLRPATFARDNALTRFIAWFYTFDTHTNVCPSLHVAGAVAAMLAGWDTPRFASRGWRLAFGVAAAAICASTVLIKQHSILDVFAALPLCLAAWFAVYAHPRRFRKWKKKAAASAAGRDAPSAS